MKVKQVVVAGAVGLMGLGGVALAQTSGQSSQSTQGSRSMTMEKQTNIPSSHLRQLSLKVKDVDKSQHKVTFEAQVSPEANIEKNGQPIKLDQLQPGDEVRAAFVPQTGEVVKLKVTRPGEKGSSGQQAPSGEQGGTGGSGQQGSMGQPGGQQ